VHQLPVLFVCEDNRWSATTASAPMIAGEGASARSESLGIAAASVDGNDVLAVHDLAQQLVGAVRASLGPRLLHALTYRIKGHVSVDLAAYRDPAELAAAMHHEPLANARARYLAMGGSSTELDAIDAAATTEVAQAMQTADAAAWPDPAGAFTDIQTTGEGQWY
jgi:pyruvate dehydrogenase E1 component alpha subunit